MSVRVDLIPGRIVSSVWSLFISQDVDRVLLGGPPGGEVAEDDPDDGSHTERDQNGGNGHDGLDIRKGLDHTAGSDPQDYADESAAHTDHQRLRQKLQLDIELSGSDRPANPDLSEPLYDRGEHDDHDAGSADQQRDGGEGGSAVEEGAPRRRRMSR